MDLIYQQTHLRTQLESIFRNYSNTQTTYEADLDDYVYVFSPAVDDEDAIAGDWMSFLGETTK